MLKWKVPFLIEYFTTAVEANAYDIAFYFLVTYEETILQYPEETLEANVLSYKSTNKFL